MNEALVDIVILSNAKVPGLRKLTQNTIDNILQTVDDTPVNVIVVEQQDIEYRDAFTIHPVGAFNFNRFANYGISIGSAEWVVVANNDLVFEVGWLSELLAADYPVVSPRNPGDARQAGIRTNQTGYITSRFFSGWCFMMKRSVWAELGGFDDCVDFWCSDNVVVEQLKEVGIEPMLVPRSRVKHLVSQTLQLSSDKADLMYRNLFIFNKKYNQHLYENSVGYRTWLKQNATRLDSLLLGIQQENKQQEN